jgi:hypothetical protein
MKQGMNKGVLRIVFILLKARKVKPGVQVSTPGFLGHFLPQMTQMTLMTQTR